ncbi:unnamed protein product [Moneuplotes crassus]|uniref:Uncharacterized protein n=1 Tax=Euplotes crassus TaxID=5936 RepID=A0AAD1XU07_EUPCR|nr:unnamed protein product [Moneuplotes crassus]
MHSRTQQHDWINPVYPNDPHAKIGGPVGGYKQQVDDRNEPPYELVIARDKKNSKNFWIKIIAWALIIVGIISLIFNLYQLIRTLTQIGKVPNGVYETNSSGFMKRKIDIVGFPEMLSKIIDVIASVLLIYQGYLTLKIAKEDHSSATKKMMKYIIYFAIAHLFLRLLQMVIVLIYAIPLTKNQNKESNEEQKLSLTTIIISIMGFSALCTCCCLLCYCGGIYACHRLYKKDQEEYESLERTIYSNINAPSMDYSHRHNQMV